MNANQRRQILSLILGVAVKDGRLADQESAFAARIYRTFGVTPGEDGWIRPTSDANQAALSLRAMPEDVREQAIDLLVQAAAVDGVVHETERAYLGVVAAAAGWSVAESGERIRTHLAR